MKISELQSLDYSDFMKLSKQEQKKVAQFANKTVKRRMENLKKAGADSFAVTVYERAGGLQSTRNQGTYALWRDVSRGQKFLGSKTSTVKGYKELISEQADRLLTPDYKNISAKERSDFWALYNEIEETGFFEELRAHDLSSDYVQTLVYELHEQGYDVNDTESVIDIMRNEFGVYDKLREREMENF